MSIDGEWESCVTLEQGFICESNTIDAQDVCFDTEQVVSHQLIKSNSTMYHKLLPTPIGMNLTLAKQLIKHQDLIKILKGIQENGDKTL
ncbi:putative protein LOC106043945 isoform X1 [Aix galericulata]|nr:putative protein LOC106043945 isoform X1 [Aix galericulata]